MTSRLGKEVSLWCYYKGEVVRVGTGVVLEEPDAGVARVATNFQLGDGVPVIFPSVTLYAAYYSGGEPTGGVMWADLDFRHVLSRFEREDVV